MTKLDRPVIDRSAYRRAFTFDWQSVVPSRSDRPELREALAQAFGLKLEPLRAAVDVMVIDRIERPVG